MLKKIMVTSPILTLFLFSISFLPLTQITEAEAQFSNKIQKQLSNKIPKQRSLSKAIKKPIEVNKARNFNKIPKQRSPIKKPKVSTIDKDLHLDDPPHIDRILQFTMTALLYELWIADRIDYLSAAASNKILPCDVPDAGGIPHRACLPSPAVARDPAPIFIDEIRSLLFNVLQCGENTDPNAVPGHFVPQTNYCGNHQDYLKMFRLGFQGPPVTEYKMHRALHEICMIPRADIYVPSSAECVHQSCITAPGPTDMQVWYWSRARYYRIGEPRIVGGEVGRGHAVGMMHSMNDGDNNCTHSAIGNNIKEACDPGVPRWLADSTHFIPDSSATPPNAGETITQHLLRERIKLRPPRTPPYPLTPKWYRMDWPCYREIKPLAHTYGTWMRWDAGPDTSFQAQRDNPFGPGTSRGNARGQNAYNREPVQQ
jgi:hypothetical protein